MRRHLKSLALAALLLPAFGGAADVRTALEGEAVQGGILVGTTSGWKRVELDGQPVPVYPYGEAEGQNGIFYIGFGREAPEKAELTLHYQDGATEHVPLQVKQRSYEVQALTLPEKMVTPPKEVEERIAADSRLIKEKRAKTGRECHFNGTFEKPAEGPISGVYGSQRVLNGKPKNPHMGIDIAAKTGDAVRAPEAGTVRLVHDMYYTGNTVLIDHGCGVNTVYAHLSKVEVKEGEAVKPGQKIGEVGATGRATGPHLHWGLNLGELRLDPALPLEKGINTKN